MDILRLNDFIDFINTIFNVILFNFTLFSQ